MTDLILRCNHTSIIFAPLKLSTGIFEATKVFIENQWELGFQIPWKILTENLELEPPGPYFATYTWILIFKGAQHLTVLADVSRGWDVPGTAGKESCSGY